MRSTCPVAVRPPWSVTVNENPSEPPLSSAAVAVTTDPDLDSAAPLARRERQRGKTVALLLVLLIGAIVAEFVDFRPSNAFGTQFIFAIAAKETRTASMVHALQHALVAHGGAL